MFTNIKMTTNEGLQNALYSAVVRGDLEETKRITSYLSRSNPWRPGIDLLCTALSYRHLQIAQLFLNQGCKVIGDRKKHGGYTTLHLAVLYGDSMMVKTILKKGAYFNSLNLEGMTPLHLLVYRKYDSNDRCLSSKQLFDAETSIILDLLLKYGANINTTVTAGTKIGFTVLHLAAECGNENIIPLLFNKKADLNIKSRFSLTPLHVAAINGHPGVVRLLLKLGAVAFAKDTRGKTALRWALEKGHESVAELFINYEFPLSQKHVPKLRDDRFVLLSAISLGNISFVKSLLNKGIPVNTYWGNYETALHVAVSRGIEEIVNLVLNRGANLTTITKDGKTPLYLAVEKGIAKIVEILLNRIGESDFMILLIGPSKCTPLHVAVMSDNEEIVRILLLKGTHVYREILSNTLYDISGESLLHIAAKNGSDSICKLLLNHGANVDTTDAKGRNAIYFAADRGNLELVNDLSEFSLKRIQKPKEWKEGYAALYVSALNGNDKIVDLLLKKGVDLKANIQGYSTPLHVAAERGYVKIVELLLENGFDVNEKKKDVTDGRSALHFAVEKQSVRIVDSLLKKGADVDAKIAEGKKRGYTPLLCAAEFGNIKIVQLLLEKGADLNAKTENSQTPLFLAVLHNHAAVVQCLVERGADLNIFGKKNKRTGWPLRSPCIYVKNEYINIRPLALAVAKDNQEIVDILLKSGAPADIENEESSPLHFAAEYDTGAILGKLLQHGAKINSTCSLGYTPIFHAVITGNTNVMIHLIKKGAELNIKTEEGDSLLHIALKAYTDKKIVKILLNCGVDVKARNKNQETPLHYFDLPKRITMKKSLHEFLLDYGAEVNAQDKEGNTPLHRAVSRKDVKSVRALLEFDADINAVNECGFTVLELYFNTYYNVSEPLVDEDEFIVKLFIEVIVVRETAGWHVTAKNLQLIKGKKKQYYEKCKRELNEMICKKFYKNVSFGDILIKNVSKVDVYFSNRSIVKILEYTDFKKLFPIYAPMLRTRIRKAKERKHLLESSVSRLKSIFDFEFPCLVVQNIFNYLRSVDLKNMARAFQPPPRFSPRLHNYSD